MASLFVRTLIIYIMLIAVLRFMGKRQIGQMQLSVPPASITSASPV